MHVCRLLGRANVFDADWHSHWAGERRLNAVKNYYYWDRTHERLGGTAF